MKKWHILTLLLVFTLGYSAIQCDVQELKIISINADSLEKRERFINLQFNDPKKNENEIKKIEEELLVNKANIDNAYKEYGFYNSLKYGIIVSCVVLFLFGVVFNLFIKKNF